MTYASRAWLATVAFAAAACAEPAVDASGAQSHDIIYENIATDTASEDAAAAGDSAEDTVTPPDIVGGWIPTASSELYGLWVHDDDDTVRALQFALLDNKWLDLFNITPVYRLYRYPSGTAPVMIQRGEYVILAGPSLTTTPRWAVDPSVVGKASVSTLLPAAKGEFALLSGAGTRVYVKQPNLLP